MFLSHFYFSRRPYEYSYVFSKPPFFDGSFPRFIMGRFSWGGTQPSSMRPTAAVSSSGSPFTSPSRFFISITHIPRFSIKMARGGCFFFSKKKGFAGGFRCRRFFSEIAFFGGTPKLNGDFMLCPLLYPPAPLFPCPVLHLPGDHLA